MMKKMRKAALLLAAMMMATLLCGCGSFDASGYIKALLDNSYKNDSTAFVDQKIGTKEQAQELYEKGIETALKSLIDDVQISDGLKGEYETVLKDMYKNVKYTVGEATKKDDGSYEVEVKYQKMKIFGPAIESYAVSFQEYEEEVDAKIQNNEEVPSDEEILEQSFTLLKDAIQESLGNLQYEDEASMTVRVELVNKVYTPNADDVANLEQQMFDTEALK